MNLTICLSAAFLILSHAAFCMPIRGQVKAGNKGLSHVVITDGINFTQTDTKGNFLLDTDQEARFVYLLTPDGYVADYQSGTPEFYLPLDPEKEDYIFQLTETGKRSHHTLLAIADVQTKTDEQFQRSLHRHVRGHVPRYEQVVCDDDRPSGLWHRIGRSDPRGCKHVGDLSIGGQDALVPDVRRHR